MPIYSRDSIGSGLKVVANENYSYADMGRILSECVQNDMTLFNAVLKNDFQENAAIREGTMVSSELTAFREFSAREAWRSLKAKLQKLWEKIKGVFRQVYAKLSVWLVRNGKAFVAMNRKVLANKAGLNDCEIPKYRKPTGWDYTAAALTLANTAKGYINGRDKSGDIGAGEIKVDDKRNELLSSVVSGATAENYAEKFKDKAFEAETDTTWGKIGNLEALFAKITSKSDALKKLKKCEKETDKSIRSMISSIEKASSDAEKVAQNAFKRASATCSAYESAVTMTCKNAIACIKFDVAQSRQIVGKLVAYSPKKESALMQELAWLEGADDFATMEDIPASDAEDEDVAGDPDVQVNIEVEDDE